jgi:hypothetical protein
MLSDDDLERALRRYQVVNPPGALESAIVSATLNVPGRFEWLWGPAAAAVVVAMWIGARIGMSESPHDPIRDQEIAFVTEMLGGGETAAAYAEIVVPEPPKQDALLAMTEERWREN